MSNCEKTLKALKEVRPISAHMTALGKIKISSEDATLNQMIDIVIQELQTAYANPKNKVKATPISLDKSTNHDFVRLTAYCQNMIGTQKPEWQILAERNGWTPPVA